MRGHLIATLACVVAAGAPAYADDPPPPPPDAAATTISTTPPPPPAKVAEATSAGDDVGDQAIEVDFGVAAGGRVTAGGLRLAGHYLYQLSDQDWFDGVASFTFGGGDPACFRDRLDAFVCEHGAADGKGFEIDASVRRIFAPQGRFRPFARAGVGIGYVSFSSDDVSGMVIPLHVGGGVRASVAEQIGVSIQGDLGIGLAELGHTLGAQPQIGLAIVAGVEFKLR